MTNQLGLYSELKGEVNEVKSEFAKIQTEFKEIKSDIKDIKTSIQLLCSIIKLWFFYWISAQVPNIYYLIIQNIHVVEQKKTI